MVSCLTLSLVASNDRDYVKMCVYIWNVRIKCKVVMAC